MWPHSSAIQVPHAFGSALASRFAAPSVNAAEDSAESAARAGMFGKLTRQRAEWRPDKLVRGSYPLSCLCLCPGARRQSKRGIKLCRFASGSMCQIRFLVLHQRTRRLAPSTPLSMPRRKSSALLLQRRRASKNCFFPLHQPQLHYRLLLPLPHKQEKVARVERVERGKDCFHSCLVMLR